MRARRIVLVLSVLALVVLLGWVAMVDRLDRVRVRSWRTVEDAAAFPPELEDPEVAVPWLAARPSFGIAFSGGGTRSATATLGQLRALADLGWLRRARYLTANSGGTWATVPYTYLPATIDEAAFLGGYVPPDAINDSVLGSGEDPRALGTAIHNAGTIDEAFAVGRGDEAFSHIVGSIFLDPFGLHDNERFFTFHRAALDKALAGNPVLRESDFYTVEREDRPYLILVGTMLAEQIPKSQEDYFPVEMTPLYTGIRERFEFEKDGEQVVVGGGYVESFGYDSYEPDQRGDDGRYETRLQGKLFAGDNPFSDRYRFTLSDAIGVSSAAPLATLSGKRFPNLVFPELRHWAIDRETIGGADSGVRREADEFQHGDGGDIDNLALMPLLVRGVESILVFVNTAQRFTPPPDGCGRIGEEFIKDDVVSLFRRTDDHVHNVVIANGETELVRLCDEFAAKRGAAAPLVHCQSYDVLANPRHGIEPYRPDICWAYLDRVRSWVEKLDPDGGETTQDLRDGRGDFDTFPHYSTFAEQGLLLIDLDRERVNALSNLTAWSIYESVEALREGLPRAGLPAGR